MILRLIEHGSISAAAADLHLSQSAVTKALQEVESIFGVMLFHREPRGLRPTSYCQAIERFASETLLGLDETIDTLQGLLSGDEGQVAVGASPGRPLALLTEALERFRAKHPRTLLKLRSGSATALMEQLDGGDIDFALVSVAPQLDRNHYAYVRVGQEPLLTLVHPEHALRRSEPPSIAELIDVGWVLPPPHEPLRDLMGSWWMANGMDQPTQLIEADAAAALTLAARLDVIAVLPESQARPYVQQGDVVAIDLTLPGLPYGLVRCRRRDLRPGSLKLLQSVNELARERRDG